MKVCACMGPMYGEPYCPCRMDEMGLPMDGEIRKKAEAESAAQWKALWQPGGWFYEKNREHQ